MSDHMHKTYATGWTIIRRSSSGTHDEFRVLDDSGNLRFVSLSSARARAFVRRLQVRRHRTKTRRRPKIDPLQSTLALNVRPV